MHEKFPQEDKQGTMIHSCSVMTDTPVRKARQHTRSQGPRNSQEYAMLERSFPVQFRQRTLKLVIIHLTTHLLASRNSIATWVSLEDVEEGKTGAEGRGASSLKDRDASIPINSRCLHHYAAIPGSKPVGPSSHSCVCSPSDLLTLSPT